MLRAEATGKLLRRAGGFTLVSTVVASMLAGFVVTGAWMAYRNLNMQWHTASIEQQMDQYANMTLKEMSNLMGWGWCDVLLQGGSRNPRMKVYFQDRWNEWGNWRNNADWADYNRRLASDSSMTITYSPFRGLLLGGDELKFANDLNYQFTGRTVRGSDRMPVLNQTDRISVTGLEFGWPTYQFELPPPGADPDRPNKMRKGVVILTMTLQYRHRGDPLNGAFSGMFGEEYVKERTYSTQIYLRNWDVDPNTFRKRYYGF